MAFQTKYSVTFKDVDNQSWYIYFQYDPWAGDVTELTPGQTPCVMRYETQSKYNTIVPSFLDIQVVYKSAVDDLFTEEDQTVRVLLGNGAMWYFIGFLITNQYFRQMGAKPHYAEFTASDQLSRLEDIKFEDASGDPYFYSQTELVALSNILAKTHKGVASLSTKEGINIYDDDFAKAVTNSPIAQSYFYPEMYWDEVTDERSDCYTVLEDILKKYGARVFQSEYEWRLQRPNAMWAIHTVRQFTAANPMVYLSNSTAYHQWNRVDEGGVWRAVPEVMKFPRMGKVEITANPGRKINVIKNSTFRDFTWSGSFPRYWESGAATVTEHDGYIELADKGTTGNPDQYIYTTNSFYKTKSIRAVIGFKAVYNGDVCVIHFMFKVLDYYYTTSGWTTVADSRYEFDVVGEGVASMTEYAELTIDIPQIQTIGYWGIPFDVFALEARIYEIEGDGTGDNELYINNFRLEPDYQGDVPEYYVFEQSNPATSYYRVKRKYPVNYIRDSMGIRRMQFPQQKSPAELRLTDSFLPELRATVYDDMYWPVSDAVGRGNITDAWGIIGDSTADQNLTELLARQYLEGSYLPVDIIRGTLRGSYTYYKALVEDEETDAYGYAKVYNPLDQAWNVARKEWTGTWVEVSPIYTDQAFDWASETYNTAGIDGNEIDMNETVVGTMTATSEAYTAVIGRMIRVKVTVVDGGGTDPPNYSIDSQTGTLAIGTNYLEFRMSSAGSKTFQINHTDGERANCVVTFWFYSLKGL